MKKKAAAYLRVPRGEHALDSQLPSIKRIARARKLKLVETYEESASAMRTRPRLKKMMAAAHRGDFDVLLIWSLDRLGRSTTGSLQAVLELDRCGVEVVSVQEPWLDTGGPIRGPLIAIFGWVTEQERAQVVARTKAGLVRARKKGVKLGRPRAGVDVRQAKRLRAKGLTFREIAAKQGVSLATLYRAMRSEKGTAKKVS